MRHGGRGASARRVGLIWLWTPCVRVCVLERVRVELHVKVEVELAHMSCNLRVQPIPSICPRSCIAYIRSEVCDGH